MSTVAELEKQILALSPAERERLATAVWDSLVSDPSVSGDRAIDPEGVEIATRRDGEIESGKVKPMDQADFLKRTGGESG